MIKTLSVAILASCLVFASSAHSGTVMIPGASGGDFVFNVTSLKELRFETTIQQQFDFSCGSAALATLLSFHYEDPVNEQEIFKAMYDAGDREKIKQDGFSLLDIKRFLTGRGYLADGFKTSLTTLEKLGIPAIVLINYNGYRHFVVVKGVTSAEVLLGDPSRGVRRMPRAQFESMWNGLLFLIRSKRDVANRHFNLVSDWKIHARAPLGMALVNTELANITWMLPGRNDF